jgi:hypothetical protein
MLILMLVEILHTVSMSVHSGRLRPVSLYGRSGPTPVSASSDGSNGAPWQVTDARESGARPRLNRLHDDNDDGPPQTYGRTF